MGTTIVAPPSACVPAGCGTPSRRYSSTSICIPLRNVGGASAETRSERNPPFSRLMDSPANDTGPLPMIRKPPSTTMDVPAAAVRFVASRVPDTFSSPSSRRMAGTLATSFPSVSACEPVLRSVTDPPNGTSIAMSRADASASRTPLPFTIVLATPVTSRTAFVVFAPSETSADVFRKTFVTPPPTIPFA